MKTKSSAGLKVTSGIKAGGMPSINHSRVGLKVKTGIKSGGKLIENHNLRLLTVV